ncbi:MAG TPA: YceI family protein [Saprospiraceae bacterium]|nr:YceI family protein [Saprospiraceae bacterium]HMU05260.1 YceI family protein [Saprospiraceae bacterium]
MSATKWSLDPTHSELQFKVKHLMITNVTGQFGGLAGEIESENEDFKNTKITFSADVNTINTSNEQRDTHLKSADFFDGATYPELKFVSDLFNAGDGKVTGDLTIKDVTKSVTLDVEYSGTNTDPWGNLKAGFSIEGKINRTDFGLTWNAALETGGVLVSEDVKISAEVQFVKQA